MASATSNPFTSNSTTHIYICGGHTGGSYSQDITKYAFGSNSNATDIGNLVGGVSGWGAGTSSTTYGYIHGGSPSYRNVIEKFSFSTDGNSTDVGDLVTGVQSSSGAQH